MAEKDSCPAKHFSSLIGFSSGHTAALVAAVLASFPCSTCGHVTNRANEVGTEVLCVTSGSPVI